MKLLSYRPFRNLEKETEESTAHSDSLDNSKKIRGISFASVTCVQLASRLHLLANQPRPHGLLSFLDGDFRPRPRL